jgi:hypothetical protein
MFAMAYSGTKWSKIRLSSKYCDVVEEDVKRTQNVLVATVTDESRPMPKKAGAKMSPPPTPTKPARIPATKPMPE